MHSHRRGLTARPRLRSALAWWIAAWLLMQALGHVHAVLHARPPALSDAVAVDASVADRLSQAFHPLGGPAHAGDDLCRLYGQLAQGDLGHGKAPGITADGAYAVPIDSAVVSTEAAPRYARQARGPPTLG